MQVPGTGSRQPQQAQALRVWAMPAGAGRVCLVTPAAWAAGHPPCSLVLFPRVHLFSALMKRWRNYPLSLHSCFLDAQAVSSYLHPSPPLVKLGAGTSWHIFSGTFPDSSSSSFFLPIHPPTPWIWPLPAGRQPCSYVSLHTFPEGCHFVFLTFDASVNYRDRH